MIMILRLNSHGDKGDLRFEEVDPSRQTMPAPYPGPYPVDQK